jgi:hypothetical protein
VAGHVLSRYRSPLKSLITLADFELGEAHMSKKVPVLTLLVLVCVFFLAVLYSNDSQKSLAQTKPDKNLRNSQSLQQQDDKKLPVCRIDFNDEAVLYVDVPYALHQAAFIPAITEVKYTHDMNYSTYSIPFRRFWELSGLESFIPWTLTSCCDGCNASGCLPSLSFTKTVPGESTSEFLWASCSGDEIIKTHRNGDLEFEYRIPRRLSGIAVIGAGVVQFFFRTGESPRLRMTDHNYETTGRPAVTFNGEVRCMSTTSNWLIVRQTKPDRSPNIPDLPLFAEAK